MGRSLHVPSIRHKKEPNRLWKLVPFLVGVLVVGLIWTERRSNKRGNAAVGTAPAGAPPMRERGPAVPAAERPPTPAGEPTPYAVTSEPEPAPAQPDPIAKTDAPGSLPREELAKAGPDMATWVNANAGDTDASESSEASAVESTEPKAEAVASSGSAQTTVPTPASESTPVSNDEGDGWSKPADKSCPDGFPIKGNASSRIYHLPGESTYEATVPEICFATEEVAVDHGYRARKR